jgi:hypothetical protein
MTREKFEMFQQIINFENGQLNEEETIKLFQELLDTYYILELQGSYHRKAQELVDNGLIVVK